jgi:hypothetical protein
MALSLVGANLVWQQARIQLQRPARTVTAGIVLRELKKYLSTYKGNPKLQLVVVDGTVTRVRTVATTRQSDSRERGVYPVRGRRSRRSDRSKRCSRRSNSATHGGDGRHPGLSRLRPRLRATSWKSIRTVVRYASGLTVTEDTTRTGAVLTLKANRLDGFVIIGQ